MMSDASLIQFHCSLAAIWLCRACKHWPMTSAYTLDELECHALLLKGALCHPPQFKVDGPIIGRWWQLGEWGKPHLHHASCPELSCIIKLVANILGNLPGCLGEGILSSDHVVDRVLDLTALAFELGFLISAMTVPVALSLASLGGGTIIVTSSASGGTHSTGIA